MPEIARFIWAAEILEVAAEDRLLEIGCGVGLAVQQIAPRLKGGSITAIDRSQSMVARATTRNQTFVENGTVRVIPADLLSFAQGAHEYNKIFAFNVNLFWTQKSIAQEVAVIRSHLDRKGRLYLFYQPPSASGFELLIKNVTDSLRSNGFEMIDTVYEKSLNSCCIVSRPS